jgi:signal peptidase II
MEQNVYRSIRQWVVLFAIIAVVLAADQITKRRVVESLRLGESRQPIPALSPFFQITRSHNTGAAFGFLPQAGDLFLVIAVVVVIGMAYFYPRITGRAILQRIGAGLICGGALGNALDRIQYGLVVDFIHYQIPGVISNVSNIADHAIVLGVVFIFVDSWLKDRVEKQAALESGQPVQAPVAEAPRPQEPPD